MSNEIYALAGAYVLDALDDDERRQFESAMADSPELAAEVESLREVAGLLGSAAVETPPEGLRVAVMARIDTVRQDRPVVDLADARRARSPRSATPGWVTTVSTAAAAIVAVVAVGMGVALAQLSDRLEEVEARGAQVAAVVAADDAQRVAADLPDGGHLSAVFSPGHGVAVVVGEDLAPLAEDRMYALWAIADGQVVPAGELVPGHASTVAGVPLDQVGLTVEPRGDLDRPTGDVIALLGA